MIGDDLKIGEIEDLVRSMKASFNLKIGNTSLILNAMTMRTPDTEVVGFDSRVQGTALHVTFIDHDHYMYGELVDILNFLQSWYGQSHYYIFTTDDKIQIEDITSNPFRHKPVGFHSICLDMNTLHDTMQIVMSSDCDMAYERAPRFYKYRTWVLRGFEKGDRSKPRFVKTLTSKKVNTPQSLWHSEFIRINYGVECNVHNPFPETVVVLPPLIRMVKYKTSNRTNADGIPNRQRA